MKMDILIKDETEIDAVDECENVCDSVFIENTRKLWREGVASDFYLLLVANKKRFAVHQLVLAAGSEYFRDYLLKMKPGDMGTSASRPFRVTDIGEETFEVILNFLYSHQTMHPDLIPTKIVLYVLYAECIPILQQAISFKELVIIKRCLLVADRNVEAVLLCESLLDSDRNVLEILIGRDTFIPSSELRLFMALLSWSIAKCQRAELDPSAQNERRFLGDLLTLVDFNALTSDELSDVVRTGVVTEQDITSVSRKYSKKSTDEILSMLYATPDQRQTAFEKGVNNDFEDIILAFHNNEAIDPTQPQSRNRPTQKFANGETSTSIEDLQNNVATSSTVKSKYPPTLQSFSANADSSVEQPLLPDSNILHSNSEAQCTPLNTPVNRFSRIASKIRSSFRRLSAAFSNSPLSMSSSPPTSPLSVKSVEFDSPTEEKPSPIIEPVSTSPQSSTSCSMQPPPRLNSSVNNEQGTATGTLPRPNSLIQEHPVSQLTEQDSLLTTSYKFGQESSRDMKEVETLVFDATVATHVSSSTTASTEGDRQIRKQSTRTSRIARPVGTAAKIIPLSETKTSTKGSRMSMIPQLKYSAGTEDLGGAVKNEANKTALHSPFSYNTPKGTSEDRKHPTLIRKNAESSDTASRVVKHPLAGSRQSMPDSKPKNSSRVIFSSLDNGSFSRHQPTTSKMSKLSEKLSRIVHPSRMPSTRNSESKHERSRSGSILAAVKDKLSHSNSFQKKSHVGSEDLTLIAVPAEAIRERSPSESSDPTAILKNKKPNATSKKTRPASWAVETELTMLKRGQEKPWNLHRNEDYIPGCKKNHLGPQMLTAHSEVDATDPENNEKEVALKDDRSHVAAQVTEAAVETVNDRHAISQRIRRKDLQHCTAKISPHDDIVANSTADVKKISSGEDKARSVYKESKVIIPAVFLTSATPVGVDKTLQQIFEPSNVKLTNTVTTEKLSSHSEIPIPAPRRKAKTVGKTATFAENSPTMEIHQTAAQTHKLAINITGKVDATSGSVSSVERSVGMEYDKHKILNSGDVQGRTKLLDNTDHSRAISACKPDKLMGIGDVQKIQTPHQLIDKPLLIGSEVHRNGNQQSENFSVKGASEIVASEPPQRDTESISRTSVNLPTKSTAEPTKATRIGRAYSFMEPVHFERDVKLRWSSHQLKPTEKKEEPKCENDKTSPLNRSSSYHRFEHSSFLDPNVEQYQPTMEPNAVTEQKDEKSDQFKSGLIRMRCLKPVQEADPFSEQAKLARKRALTDELERLHASALKDDNNSKYSKLIKPLDEPKSNLRRESTIAQAELLAASRGAFTPHIAPNSSLLDLKRSIDVRRSFNAKPKQSALTPQGGAQDDKLPSTKMIKQALLGWCQSHLKDYPVKVWNFSSCWADGMAFCALAHHFATESTKFDFNKLNPRNRKENLTLAFQVAEKNGVVPLLEVDDMLEMGDEPDWKCIFVYVQSFYRQFKDRT